MGLLSYALLFFSLLLPIHAMAATMIPPETPAERHTAGDFTASIAFAEGEIHVTIPPLLREKAIREKWDFLAFLYRTDEAPVHKFAYALEDTGNDYLLRADFPENHPWSLELFLSPPKKGEPLKAVFDFFGQQPLR